MNGLRNYEFKQLLNRYAWRIPREDEYEHWKNGGDLLAKDEMSNIDIGVHIRQTRESSCWLSMSDEFYKLIDWNFRQEGGRCGILLIDKTKIGSFYDMSTYEKCKRAGLDDRQAALATARSELLVKYRIPHDAVTVILEPDQFHNIMSWKNWRMPYVSRINDSGKAKRRLSHDDIRALRDEINEYSLEPITRFKMKGIINIVRDLYDNVGEHWTSTVYNKKNIRYAQGEISMFPNIQVQKHAIDIATA